MRAHALNNRTLVLLKAIFAPGARARNRRRM
jgi:hypothetical protein